MLTDQEKQFLKDLVKKEIDNLEKEGSTIIEQDKPGFLAGEEKYDQFLKDLLEKLQ